MLSYTFITFLVIVCIQLCFYIILFGNFSFARKSLAPSDKTIPVSIIICAKNEADNLENNLPFFINQNYKALEIILINDCSHDDTLDIMERYQTNHPDLIKIVNVAPNEQFWGSKKYALTLGIKAASNEHLLFSDADCKPISNNWVFEMTKNFSPDKQLILGYGAYSKIRNSFLNKVIRFETLLTAIQYFSYAKFGMPYMGVGRNLAYTKSLFFKANGFVNHMKIKSGDDDLFVNQIATKRNTAICYSPESTTISDPKKSFKEWFNQKRRHITSASHYKFKHQFLLGLFYCSQFLFFALGTFLLMIYQWELIVPLIALRYVAQFISFAYAAKKLNELDLLFFTPVLELFLILTQISIFITNLISKPTRW